LFWPILRTFKTEINSVSHINPEHYQLCYLEMARKETHRTANTSMTMSAVKKTKYISIKAAVLVSHESH